ncbi:MAG: phosphoenolpyruvate--protein phosphotransferase [Pyrinomonadaceae bacterium]
MTTSGQKTSERRLRATSVSRGIGVGQVFYFAPVSRRVIHADIDEEDIPAEIERLTEAVRSAKLKINNLAKQQNSTSSVFGAHLLIVDESSFIGDIEAVIRDRRVNAEWAVRLISEHRRKRQTSVAEESFREKASDIVDVAEHLITELTGSIDSEWAAPPEAVIVARELRPSNIVLIAKSLPAAIITERGGWTSHASILARELRIPMVTGLNEIQSKLANRDNVIVDAVNGEVIVDPDLYTIETFRTINIERDVAEEYVAAPQHSCVTRDGTEIVIRANAESAAFYETARHAGAVGIGLFRSESLIRAAGQIPSEDEQYESYLTIAEAVGDDGVRIRTFDIGVEQFSADGGLPESNPSLGLRSIRLSLTEPEYFRVQISALLRASAEHEIDIILPMVTGLDEILEARELIDAEREKLIDADIPVGAPRLGVMIEVPSAVLTSLEIAENVDFLCLGTNDLVQYLLAVDRDNEAVAALYQTLHPAVFRAVKQVISAGDTTGKPVIVCGEMAGSPFYVPLLIGAGARELSVNINSIQNLRHLIDGITVGECATLFEHVMHSKTADEAENELRGFYLENWSDLFPQDLLSAKHR